MSTLQTRTLSAIVCAMALWVAPFTQAADLYWSGNGTTQGGAGTWDISTARWGSSFSGPFGTMWVNANKDTARFGSVAGAVALGANIDVGGLWFGTTAYPITTTGYTLNFAATDNTITLNSIAATTITGPVGGSGNVILTAVNPTTTGTLTLNGTSTGGWSGTTTVNNGITMPLEGANQALLNTTGITLNGGGITLANTSATEASFDRVANGATITANGGTITVNNTASGTTVYSETLGALALTSGQLNVVQTTANTTPAQTLTLGAGSLTHTAANTSAITFSGASLGASAKNSIIVTSEATTAVGAIIGPWATFGTTAAAQTDYATYNRTAGGTPNTFGIQNANIAASAETTWASGANATLSGATSLTALRTLNSLRYTGAAATLTLGSNNLETYGILNGGSGALQVGTGTAATGKLTTPTGGGNLYVTAANNQTISLYAPISDNSGAVTLVKSGAGNVNLAGRSPNNVANTFTGGIVLNGGTLTPMNSGVNNNALTVNGNSTFSVDQENVVNTTTVSGITLNNGSILSVAANVKAFTCTGAATGTGGISLTQAGSGSTTVNLNSTANTFTGPIYFNLSQAGTLNVNSLSDAAGAGRIVYINSNGASLIYDTGATAPLVLNNRQVEFAGVSGTIKNNNTASSYANTITINTDLLVSAAGNKTLTLGGTNTGTNLFAGLIADGGTAVISLTKADAGQWILSGANTYTGATAVNGGTLTVMTGSGTRCTSPVTIANTGGCIFGAKLAATDGRWTSSTNLTVAGVNSEIDIDYGSTAPSTSVGPIQVTTLTVTAAGKLKILSRDPRLFVVGSTYPLINFTGSGPATATGWTLTLPTGVTGSLGISGNHLNVAITANTAKFWNSGSANWDTGTPWANGVGSVGFSPNDTVYLGDDTGVSGNPTLTVSGAAVSPAAVIMNSVSHDYTISGNPITNGTVTVNAPSRVLTLNGANTYGGATTISAGTLQLGNATALGTTSGNTTIANGATLNLNGQTIAEPLTIAGIGVGANGALINNSGTAAAVTASIASGTYAVGGTGNLTLSTFATSQALTKVGTGTLTLSGSADNNALALTASGGTVVLAKASAATVHACGNSSSVASGATIQLGGSGAYQLYGGASLTVNSGGVFDLAGMNHNCNALGGNVNLNGTGISSGGALINSAEGTTSTITLGTGSIVLQSASSIGGAGNIVIAGGTGANGAITGSGALTKDGNGTLTLINSVTSTYTGATTINAGTLALGGNNVLADTTALSIGAATLDAATFTDTVGTLDVTGSAVINLGVGAALAFADSSAVDWTGGTLALTGKLGANALRFGTTAGGLTPTQLLCITINGNPVYINRNGFLSLTSEEGNSAPTWNTSPVVKTLAAKDVPYASTLINDATDLDSDPLTFAKISGPAWLSVAGNGALTGTPGSGDLGNNTFTVTISDGIAAPITNTLQITVVAANLKWDANGTGSGLTDGAGDWLNANMWWNGSANTNWDNITPNNALIGNGAAGGTITLGTVTACSVIFTNFTGTYTLTNGSLTQSGGITVNANGSVSSYTPIAGSGGITKAGTGTLTLNAPTNTYSGGTVINAGTLTFPAYNYTPNPILGTGPITVNSSGTLRLERNSFTNSITLNSGTVTSGNSFSSTLSGPITLNGTSTFNIAGAFNVSGAISGSGGLIKTGGSVVPLSGLNTYTGVTTITGGALQFKRSLYNNDTTQWTPANITVASNAVLLLNVGGSGEFTAAQAGLLYANLTPVNNNGFKAGAIFGFDTANASPTTVTVSSNLTDSVGTGGGAVCIKKYGANTLELTGANTYSGKTYIETGTLKVSSFNYVSSGTLTPNTSSSLGAPTNAVNGTIELGSRQFAMDSTLTYTGPGEITDRSIYMSFNSSDKQTINASGSGLLKFTSPFTVNPSGGSTAGGLYLRGSGIGEIVGWASALPGTLEKADAGTWTISGAASANAVIVSGGALIGVAGGSSSNSAVTVNNTAGCILGIRVDDNSKQWTCRALTSAGTNAKLAFGFTTAPSQTIAPLNVTNTLTFTGVPGITVDPANLVAGSYPLIVVGGTYPSGTPTVTIGHGLTGTTSWTGNTLYLNVSGTNTLPLKWAANGTGIWNINTTANWKDQAGTATTYLNGDIVSGDPVVFDDTYLSADTTVTLSTNVKPYSVTVSNSTYNYTFSGSGKISGPTGLTKSGSGNVTLVSTNSYTGATIVNAGTLTLGDGGSLSAISSLAVSNGATLVVNRSDAFSQATGLNGQAITGDGGFTQSGVGTTTLTAANAYTGATTINTGTLALGVNNVLADTTALSIGNGTLDMATFSDMAGPLGITGTNGCIHLGVGATVSFADSSAVTWPGTKLEITGEFVPGTSIRFGTSSSALTAEQLGKISILGGDSVALDENGYLVFAYTLTVISSHGTPAPTNGAHVYASGESISCLVSGTEQLGTTQYVCTGWVGTGSVPSQGATTNVTITITNDSSIVWQWQTQYRLATGTNGNGSVTPGGWCVSDTNVAVTATPAANWYFVGWSGDTNGCAITGNVITVAMDRARAVTANFSSTGLYMVIDLTGGMGATNYPVTYLEAVPPGGWTDEYKTDKLIMRKIPAGTFTMGSPTNELGRGSNETQHQVTLTKDFFIGVFEVTQRQWELVMGTKPSFFNNATYYASRPVEQVSYYDIRENPANSNDPAVDWPANSAVNATSFMGKLRAKTGLSMFDLPTESQWEYACRAGTTTALNTGYNLTSTGSDPRMDVAGRYRYNGGYISGTTIPSSSCTIDNGTAKVGSYLPNAWGLYDMHGNVWEWCLDWYGTYPGTVTDPEGSASGSGRVRRGGSWVNGAVRSADRGSYDPDIRDNGRSGFRAARTLPVNPYSLTIVGGTGGGGYDATTAVPVAADTPTPGQAFVRWTVSPTNAVLGAGFSATQAMTTVTMPAYDVTLAAVFATNVYTLSVVSTYGGAVPGTVAADYGAALSQFVTNSPVADGVSTQYVCTGASMAGNAYTLVSPTNVTLTLTNNATLTWQWQTQYRLSTATNGNGSVTTGGWCVSGTNVTVTATPAANGHFEGWTGDTNGCVIVGNVLTAAMTQARSVTANFHALTASSVTFDAQGGTVPSPVSKVVTNDLAYGELATTTRTGYTFAGWRTGSAGAGTLVTSETTVTNLSDHTLYAAWKANYVVAFDPEGGTVNPPDKTVVYEAAYGALPMPAYSGHVFGGWWTGADGTGSQVTNTTPVTEPSNHTLYARWDFAYTLHGDAYTIDGYYGTNGMAVIPSVLAGLPVTGLGEGAFYACANLTNVMISGSVTNIGGNAFYGCSKLTGIDLPSGLTGIGAGAFYGCSKITQAFIPAGVGVIGERVFCDCSGLTNVTISAAVAVIGDHAFFGCSKLPGVNIPSGVSSIGVGAFAECSSLLAITVDEANGSYSSLEGVLFDEGLATLIQCPGGKTGSYTVPGSVTRLWDAAFRCCARLTDITIPGSVTDMGEGTFAECTGLTGVTIQNGVPRIGAMAFYHCTGLANVTLPGSVTNVGSSAFFNCSGLTGVTIPVGVIGIGESAFFGCQKLAVVAIPSSVTSIGARAFANCPALTAINVDGGNLSYCSVDGVLYDRGMETLVQCPSGRTGSYRIPSTVTALAPSVFYNCAGLTSVTVLGNVATIGDEAFAYCTDLTGMFFAGREPSLGEDVFAATYNVSIYNMPGPFVWGATLDGRLVVLWNPSIKKDDGLFGFVNNRFGFTVTGTANIPVVVETCTSLTGNSWVQMKAITLNNGSFYFSDSNWTMHPARFYRLRTP